MGARVIAAASNQEKLDIAKRLGADEVVNYGDGELTISIVHHFISTQSLSDIQFLLIASSSNDSGTHCFTNFYGSCPDSASCTSY